MSTNATKRNLYGCLQLTHNREGWTQYRASKREAQEIDDLNKNNIRRTTSKQKQKVLLRGCPLGTSLIAQMSLNKRSFWVGTFNNSACHSETAITPS